MMATTPKTMSKLGGMRFAGNVTTFAPAPPDGAAPAAVPPPKEAPTADPAPVDPSNPQGDRFHMLMVVEGAWSGDNRWINEGALTWRDLPLPAMGQADNTPEHEGSVLVGDIDTIERVGNEVHGYGTWATTPEAMAIRHLVDSGQLRGVSVDMDDFQANVVIDVAAEDAMWEAEPDDDGNIVFAIPQEKLVITAARLMGATILPFPAFQEAFVENVSAAAPALAASGAPTGFMFPTQVPERLTINTSLTASGEGVRPPMFPPAAWFDNPGLSTVTPLTVGNDGHVQGHLAAWDSCHIGFGQCVPPPRTATNYTHFRLGEVICQGGARVATGCLTLKGGHAELSLSPAEARAHYDNTESAVADIAVGEDRYGIWINGSVRPGTSAANVRALMASDVSGDWRRIGGRLELIGIASVNVPGFSKPFRMEQHSAGNVVSMVAAAPLQMLRTNAAEDIIRKALAASIGRSEDQRRKELHAAVHGRAA